MIGVEVRIDPGSKGTGVAITVDQNTPRSSAVVARARRGLFAVELVHRGSHISKKLKQRAAYRRRRRTANLRYRPQRSSRARKPGWLPPSIQHRVDSTVSVVRRLARLFPVREVHMERVAFDTHALSAGRSLEGAEYQQGTLFGYEIREYLLAKWRRACAYCGAAGVPLQIEHIHPRRGVEAIGSPTSRWRAGRATRKRVQCRWLSSWPIDPTASRGFRRRRKRC